MIIISINQANSQNAEYFINGTYLKMLNSPVVEIKENVLKNVTPGAIIIMHMSHPESCTYVFMLKIIPEQRKLEYKFTRLNQFPLKAK